MAGPGGEQRRPPPPLRAERWWAPRGSAARSCQRYDFGRRRHAQPRHSGCRVRAIPRRRGNDRRGGRRCTPRRGRGFRRCPGLRRPSRVTGGGLFSRKNSRFLLLSLRTPYTHCAPARARRCRCYRTLAHAALPAVLATCSARLPPPHSLQATVPHVLADAAAAALPAIVAPPPALANAAASALLALAAAPTVLAAPLPPPYSMHALRRVS